ncbi:D-glucuronate isomerase [Paramaledivibacter caminithermalis DSM 15212]|uniref:Uronate isomerase n=1 Tax=Paramaledivibacter caminithermalis (strain DSM 15212 / CIP 107654 / DViRD3) TaxID=1121301 RepID=A0A1M6NT75_PARC5|nr:glucuronate isomerase [Paramaledivibacter caminithermalis]SHJ98953.1 D-glucuronate isomerase [Paramaledivibacter caminithermalis DSM 15212]
MKKFMDENFLLINDAAVKLYHDYAKNMPIYDYHCHLKPEEIWEDKVYKNITEVWLYGDHYKWRAMRSNGIDEKYITGDASDYDKFMAWAKTIPYCIGNPLYHWTHLELQRYFGIYEILNEDTAKSIWNRCNEMLNSKDFTARALMKKFNVKLVGTTDDPTESLEYHKKIREEGKLDAKVVPSFRPDKGIDINKEGFVDWINKLSEVTNRSIEDYEDLLEALKERIEFFHEQGCRISDHALDYVPYKEAEIEEVRKIFEKAMNMEDISLEEEEKYKTFTLAYMARIYSQKNWTMQLHIGAMRNNNTTMYKLLGADTGFDSINDYEIAVSLSRFLDLLDKEKKLPKTILYTLNPKDNYVLGTMLGNFQGDGIPGKIQFGSGWWFNDQKDGMIKQMTDLANLGLLSRFVGMLTDSRSFLSYTRHEYFRRILCNLIGEWVENGEAPNDMKLLGSMVQNICYNNAKDYFGIDI